MIQYQAITSHHSPDKGLEESKLENESGQNVLNSSASPNLLRVNVAEKLKHDEIRHQTDDSADKATERDYEHDYDEQADNLSSMPASATGGFAMAGSGKAITVNEDEMAKAAKMLAEKEANVHGYYDQADHLSSMPASTGGFSMAGSGKAITVNEDEMAKAAKMLAEKETNI